MSQTIGQHLKNWTRWNNRDKVWNGTNSLFKWRFRNHRRCCCLSSLYSASYKRNRNATFSRSQPPTPLKTITTPTPFLSRRLRLCLHLRWAISRVYFLEFAFVSQARGAGRGGEGTPHMKGVGIYKDCLCFNMVSFKGQKKLEPRPDWSPLGA